MATEAGENEGYFEYKTSAENTRELMDKLREIRWEIAALEDMIETDAGILDGIAPDDIERIEHFQDTIIRLSFEHKSRQTEYKQMLDLYDYYYAQMHNGHLPQ